VRMVVAAAAILLPFSAADAAWQKIDCSTSRLTVPGQVACFQGPPLPHTDYVGGSIIPIQCVADHGSTYTKSAGTTGFVKYDMQRPGSEAHCVTGGGADGPLFLMQHVNHTTNLASDWAQLTQDGDRFFATFTSKRLEHCRAFIAPGPPVGSPRRIFASSAFSSNYYQYRLIGYLCLANGAPPNDADVQAYIGTIHISTQ
jgi:hypothetical protein